MPNKIITKDTTAKTKKTKEISEIHEMAMNNACNILSLKCRKKGCTTDKVRMKTCEKCMKKHPYDKSHDCVLVMGKKKTVLKDVKCVTSEKGKQLPLARGFCGCYAENSTFLKSKKASKITGRKSRRDKKCGNEYCKSLKSLQDNENAQKLLKDTGCI